MSAGLKAGDVITAINGTAVTTADDLTAKIGALKPGDKVTLSVTRNGSTLKVDVTLGTRARLTGSLPLPPVEISRPAGEPSGDSGAPPSLL